MPNNVIDSPRDEHKWKRAEQIAAKSGHKGDYAYIMGIYKKMKPDHQFKKSASERDWVRIAGDIISYAAWDSEKVAAAFNAELELIEIEKEAAKSMSARSAKKILTAAMGGKTVSPARLAQAERVAIARGGPKGDRWLPKGWQQYVAKTRGVPKNPNTGKSLAERGWDIPRQQQRSFKPDARMNEAAARGGVKPQPKSTFFKDKAPRPNPIAPGEKVVKAPARSAKGKTQTQAVADQTKTQAGQAQAAAEAAKKAPPTPQKVRSGWAEREFGAPGMKMPPPSAYQGAGIVPRSSGEVVVRGATKRAPAAAAPKPSPRAEAKPPTKAAPKTEQVRPAARSGGSPPPPLKFTNPFDSLKRAPTPKTPAATVGGSPKRPQPAPKSEVSGAAAQSFKQESTALVPTRPNLTTLDGRVVPQSALRPGETAKATSRVEGKATGYSPTTQARVDKVTQNKRTAEDLSRLGLKPTVGDRVKATGDRVQAGVAKLKDQRAAASRVKASDRRAAAARKGEVKTINQQLSKIDQQIRLAESQGNYGALSQLAGQKQVLQNELKRMGSPVPKSKALAQPAKPTQAPQQPQNVQPAPAQNVQQPQPRLEAGPTPVQEAASQSPGFWQKAKNTWGGMSENQRLLAVGATGLGAGALANRRPQQPPMYGPAPAPQYYQMAPQPPMYR
tara:strand:+ start:268 stop:2283 length:2016 start_codon:yes stop_codon:yes gene_type:complete